MQCSGTLCVRWIKREAESVEEKYGIYYLPSKVNYHTFLQFCNGPIHQEIQGNQFDFL